jgi:hypothetical protein
LETIIVKFTGRHCEEQSDAAISILSDRGEL